MSKLNHSKISSILNSEVVGQGKFGHGQINSLGDAQRYFDMLATGESPAQAHKGESVDIELVAKAFHAVTDARGDRGSSDIYIADPERNAAYLAKCRELGLHVSDYTLNKALLNARKNKELSNLNSVITSIDYEEFAFASEFAATELKYKTGATIDDILCVPGLAARFDSIAQRISPGFKPFEYRWALLSIRKREKPPQSLPMPEFTGHFRLVIDPVDQLPDVSGIYQLFENQRLLYVRSTEHLRHGIELHRNPKILRAVTEKLWETKPEDLLVSYAVFEDQQLLRDVEERIIEVKKPLFNVSRAAA